MTGSRYTRHVQQEVGVFHRKHYKYLPEPVCDIYVRYWGVRLSRHWFRIPIEYAAAMQRADEIGRHAFPSVSASVGTSSDAWITSPMPQAVVNR